MADPIFRTENPSQSRMPRETNTAEVVHFALVPIGGRPMAATDGTSGSSPSTSPFQRGKITLSTKLCLSVKLQR